MLFELQEAAKERDCVSLIDYLINDRFKKKIVVTASLRARSVVALQMVADINPSTPIVFCHAGTLFPESREYKDFIIERLGFSDIREPQQGEFETAPGDYDHVEWMKAYWGGTQNFVKEAVHLNKTMKDFECWISAVYHPTVAGAPVNRVDIEGKLIRVNPLLDWTRDAVNEFMNARDLPFHKLASRKTEYPDDEGDGLLPSYAY